MKHNSNTEFVSNLFGLPQNKRSTKKKNKFKEMKYRINNIYAKSVITDNEGNFVGIEGRVMKNSLLPKTLHFDAESVFDLSGQSHKQPKKYSFWVRDSRSNAEAEVVCKRKYGKIILTAPNHDEAADLLKKLPVRQSIIGGIV